MTFSDIQFPSVYEGDQTALTEDAAPPSITTVSAAPEPGATAATSETSLEIESDGVTVRLPLSSPATRVAELAAALRTAQ